MDDLDEFLDASNGDGEYFAGSTQECFDKLQTLNPNKLPMWERWRKRNRGDVWETGFTNDYNKYIEHWVNLRTTIKGNGGNFGERERFQLTRLAGYFDDLCAFWAG